MRRFGTSTEIVPLSCPDSIHRTPAERQRSRRPATFNPINILLRCYYLDTKSHPRTAANVIWPTTLSVQETARHLRHRAALNSCAQRRGRTGSVSQNCHGTCTNLCLLVGLSSLAHRARFRTVACVDRVLRSRMFSRLYSNRFLCIGARGRTRGARFFLSSISITRRLSNHNHTTRWGSAKHNHTL